MGVTPLAEARLAPPKTQVKSAFYRPTGVGTAHLQHARAILGAELVDFEGQSAKETMTIEHHTIDGNEITDWTSFHAVFFAELEFPGYYGHNMNAWIDCMTDFCDKETVVSLTITNVTALKSKNREIYDALVECSAFVNWRLAIKRENPAIALAFYQ